MNFEHSAKVQDLILRLERFMHEHIYPAEINWRAWATNHENLWKPGPEWQI